MQINMIRFDRVFYHLWASIFLIGLFTYGFCIFNFHLGIDMDYAFMGGVDSNLVVQARYGRWAMWAYYYFLLPGVYFPFTGSIIALVALSFSYSIYASSHKNLTFSTRLIFGALAISFPTFGAMLYFGFQIAQVSCSAGIAIIAYLLARDGKTSVTKYVLPIILCAFSVFTYQSLILIIPALYLIDALLSDAPLLKKSRYVLLARLFIICLISIVVYYFCSRILYAISGISKSSYSDNFNIWTNQSLLEGWISVYHFIIYRINLSYMTTIWFALIPIIVLFVASKRKLTNIIITVSIIFFMLFPFFCLGIALPVRSWFFAPIIFAGLFMAAIKKSSFKSQIVFTIVCFMIVCFNSSINAKLTIADSLASERDQIIAARIYDSIHDLEIDQLETVKASLIISTPNLEPILPKVLNGLQECYGGSFFAWFKQTSRIYSYMRMLGISLPPALSDPGRVQQIRAMEYVQNMRAYPDKGFVQVVDGVLIVKMNSDMN